MAGELAEVVVRNPSSHSNFSLQFSMDGTIAELQARLQECYHGNPAPADQVVS